jgi:hypothetical protein
MDKKTKVLGNHKNCLGIVVQMPSGGVYCKTCRAQPVPAEAILSAATGAEIVREMFSAPADLVALVKKAVRS